MTHLEAPQNTNVDQGVILANSAVNLRRPVRMFVEGPALTGSALIVGGGPSLRDTLANLRWKQQRGGAVFALNGAYDWLVDRGVRPAVHVLLDARPSTVAFVQSPSDATAYLVASQVHPSVFDALEGRRVIQWCATAEGMREIAELHPELPIVLIGGGETVGLKAILLAYLAGYRNIEVFGLDSSYQEEAHHAYPQAQNDAERVEEVTVCGKTFRAAPWMKRQAFQFIEQRAMLPCNVKVNGSGLLPWLARHTVTSEGTA